MEEVGRNLPQRVHTILESISSGVLLLDDQGIIESVNPQAARLLETSQDRLEGLGKTVASSSMVAARLVVDPYDLLFGYIDRARNLWPIFPGIGKTGRHYEPRGR